MSLLRRLGIGKSTNSEPSKTATSISDKTEAISIDMDSTTQPSDGSEVVMLSVPAEKLNGVSKMAETDKSASKDSTSPSLKSSDRQETHRQPSNSELKKQSKKPKILRGRTSNPFGSPRPSMLPRKKLAGSVAKPVANNADQDSANVESDCRDRQRQSVPAVDLTTSSDPTNHSADQPSSPPRKNEIRDKHNKETKSSSSSSRPKRQATPHMSLKESSDEETASLEELKPKKRMKRSPKSHDQKNQHDYMDRHRQVEALVPLAEYIQLPKIKKHVEMPVPGSRGYKVCKSLEKQRQSMLAELTSNHPTPTTIPRPIQNNNMFSPAVDNELKVLYHFINAQLSKGKLKRVLELCHQQLKTSYKEAGDKCYELLKTPKKEKRKFVSLTSHVWRLREKIAGTWCLYAHLFIQISGSEAFLNSKWSTTYSMGVDEQCLWDQAIAILILSLSCPLVGNHAAITLSLSRLRLRQRPRGKPRHFPAAEAMLGTSAYLSNALTSSVLLKNNLALSLGLCQDGMQRSSPPSPYSPRFPKPQHVAFDEKNKGSVDVLSIQQTTEEILSVLSLLISRGQNDELLNIAFFQDVLNLPENLDKKLLNLRKSANYSATGKDLSPLPYLFVDRASTRLLCLETNCLSILRACLDNMMESKPALSIMTPKIPSGTSKESIACNKGIPWDNYLFFQTINLDIVEKGEPMCFAQLEYLSQSAAFFGLDKDAPDRAELIITAHAKYPLQQKKYHDLHRVCNKCGALFNTEKELEIHAKRCAAEDLRAVGRARVSHKLNCAWKTVPGTGKSSAPWQLEPTHIEGGKDKLLEIECACCSDFKRLPADRRYCIKQLRPNLSVEPGSTQDDENSKPAVDEAKPDERTNTDSGSENYTSAAEEINTQLTLDHEQTNDNSQEERDGATSVNFPARTSVVDSGLSHGKPGPPRNRFLGKASHAKPGFALFSQAKPKENLNGIFDAEVSLSGRENDDADTVASSVVAPRYTCSKCLRGFHAKLTLNKHMSKCKVQMMDAWPELNGQHKTNAKPFLGNPTVEVAPPVPGQKVTDPIVKKPESMQGADAPTKSRSGATTKGKRRSSAGVAKRSKAVVLESKRNHQENRNGYKGHGNVKRTGIRRPALVKEHGVIS